MKTPQTLIAILFIAIIILLFAFLDERNQRRTTEKTNDSLVHVQYIQDSILMSMARELINKSAEVKYCRDVLDIK